MSGRTPVLDHAHPVREFAVPGVRAWTTTIANGSFGLGSDEAVGVVSDRFTSLAADLAVIGAPRLATALQVHGATVTRHESGWTGWLRGFGVDGHVTLARGTALAVTVADCTPVFVAHARGVALLHAGWRGTAAHILEVGLNALAGEGIPADECAVHLGPSICGGCYEVGPEVIEAVTGMRATGKALLDVRSVLAEQAHRLGVRDVTTSTSCTRCGERHFYSHRAGDAGRNLGILAFV